MNQSFRKHNRRAVKGGINAHYRPAAFPIDAQMTSTVMIRASGDRVRCPAVLEMGLQDWRNLYGHESSQGRILVLPSGARVDRNTGAVLETAMRRPFASAGESGSVPAPTPAPVPPGFLAAALLAGASPIPPPAVLPLHPKSCPHCGEPLDGGNPKQEAA